MDWITILNTFYCYGAAHEITDQMCKDARVLIGQVVCFKKGILRVEQRSQEIIMQGMIMEIPPKLRQKRPPQRNKGQRNIQTKYLLKLG